MVNSQHLTAKLVTKKIQKDWKVKRTRRSCSKAGTRPEWHMRNKRSKAGRIILVSCRDEKICVFKLGDNQLGDKQRLTHIHFVGCPRVLFNNFDSGCKSQSATQPPTTRSKTTVIAKEEAFEGWRILGCFVRLWHGKTKGKSHPKSQKHEAMP